MKGFPARCALLGVAALVVAGRLTANTVTFSFTGTVSFVDPARVGAIGRPGIVSVGEKLRGTVKRFPFFVDLVAEPEPSQPVAQE